MPTNKQRVDLAGLFQSVTDSLAENQQQLDHLDEYNHDHGDNMVQTFQTITNALEKKKGSTDGAALAYAAKQLSRSANSSSSKLYADNLAQAAVQFKGKQVDSKGALELLSTLIGAGQTQSAPQTQSQGMAGADMLGALLGGMGGAQQQPQQPQTSGAGDLLGALLGGMGGAQQQPQQPQSAGGDLLGSLLGGLTGQSTGSGQSSGLGLDDLLAGGMAYLQAKQSGQGNAQALIQAFLAASGMGQSAHRQESTQVVVQSFLQALSGMTAGR